jgi:hypothetical protein
MKNVKDVALAVKLHPEKKLSKARQEKFWTKVLSADFAGLVGPVDIDHMLTEDHIQFNTKDQVEIVVYKDSYVSVGDDEYSLARSKILQKSVDSVLRGVKYASGKAVAYRASLQLHLHVTRPSAKRFFAETVRVSPTSKFRRVFGKFKGFRGFLFQIEDNLGLAVTLPDHLDFMSRNAVKAGRSKNIVAPFTASCFKYIELMG